MEQLVVRALLMGGVVALLLAVARAALVRRQLEHRMAAIRHTALEIEAGDLSRRIPVPEADDEFTRLNRDINRMLDRIQRLMEGIRDVSNAIAHDLRTPLGRIRNRLDEMLRPGATSEQLRDAAALSNAFQNVADALHALHADADTLKAAVAAEQATRTTLEITTEAQRLGAVNYLAVLSAQQAYRQALLARVQAQAARLSDTVALFQALGGGWWIVLLVQRWRRQSAPNEFHCGSRYLSPPPWAGQPISLAISDAHRRRVCSERLCARCGDAEPADRGLPDPLLAVADGAPGLGA
jgi:HAMP domain-containing protein